MIVELVSALALLAPGDRTVTCADVIGSVPFPPPPHQDVRYRSRTVLGAVSAPGRVVPQASRTGPRAWPLFAKWGMVVRGGPGEPVTVTVPLAWRNRARIVWGNGHGAFHTIRLPRCGDDAAVGHAFAGGFYVRSVPACVPLRFTVGGRTALLRFGITRRCR